MTSNTARVIVRLMEERPIVANSILCLNLWIAGDILAQWSENKVEHSNNNTSSSSSSSNDKEGTSKISTTTRTTSNPLSFMDWTRTAQCASYGAFVTGPIIALWYPYLHRVTTKYIPLKKYGVWAVPVAKVLCDEFIMDPPTLVMFYGYMNICEGGDYEKFKNKLKSEFLTSWLTSLTVWPIVLLGTFRYVPLYTQAPVINACCIVWDGFLSHRNSLARRKENQKASTISENNMTDDLKLTQ